MSEKYLSIDLNDPRAGAIAEVLSNKSCKKILDLLAEKEMSESDIASALKMPLNTVGYNIKKLFESGLIEKAKAYFWSSRGKKIPTYRVSNKKIVISPRSTMKGIIPSIIITGILAFGINYYFKLKSNYYDGVEAFGKAALSASDAGASSSSMISNAGQIGLSTHNVLSGIGYTWLWFLLGALVALFVFLAWNWRKI